MGKLLTKKNILLTVGALFLGGISFSINYSQLEPEQPTLNLPKEIKDEGFRLIQKASENYFFHEYPEANENYHKAIAIFEARNDFRQVGIIHESIGDVYLITNNIPEAEREYLTAATSHEKAQFLLGKAQALKKIGDMYVDLEQGKTGANWYMKALAEINREPASLILAQIEESLGRYYWALKDKSKAIEFITSAQKTFGNIGHQMGAEHMSHILDILHEKGSELHPHAMRSRRPSDNKL
jgi:tetratricopeptide (TPR) repeat protein